MRRRLYLDTNILSELAKRGDVTTFIRWMEAEDFELALSGPLFVELSAAVDRLVQLPALLLGVDVRVLFDAPVLLAAEIARFPNGAGAGATQSVSPKGTFEVDALLRVLRRPSTAAARTEVLANGAQMPARHGQLKANFPPGPDGRYSLAQGEEYVEVLVRQMIETSPDVDVALLPAIFASFRASAFPSLHHLAVVNFWTLYKRGEAPSQTSDMGDLTHLQIFPYADVVITERRLMLREAHAAFAITSLRIHTIDFAREARWLD